MSGATDPYAPFRPVTGARVARVAGLASVLVFGLVAVLGPTYAGAGPTMALLNRIFIAGLGLAMGAFLWRYALIRAIPSAAGLVVVNLVLRRELEWSQVASVTFTPGAPWVVLELTDTEELAVMAIQRADGERAKREASRLAALVEHHQR